MPSFSLQMEGLDEFAAQLRAAASAGLKEELRQMMKTVGIEFLRIVQAEVKATDSVVTGNLISSFSMGGSGNVWNESDGGLTIEVGSNVEYARFVNDGHFTTPAGVQSRFVPGSWKGGRFIYEPGAKTGMVLKRKWINGKHYWEAAMRHSEPEMEKLAEQAVEKWIAKYFG